VQAGVSPLRSQGATAPVSASQQHCTCSFALGIEILVVGVLLWLVQTTLQIRYLRSKTDHPRYWAVTRIIQTQFANIPFCIAGILLLCGSEAGLYWLAPGFILSLVAGVASAWVLLIEILR
jgi:hypothetical protein